MSNSAAIHESLRTEAKKPLDANINRKFGYVFAVFFLLLGVLAIYKGKPTYVRHFSFSFAFAILALTVPRVLAPLRRLWMTFGDSMHMIMSPILMGVIFFCIISPLGFFFRIFGSKSIPLAFDKSAKSYWTLREPGEQGHERLRRLH